MDFFPVSIVQLYLVDDDKTKYTILAWEQHAVQMQEDSKNVHMIRSRY
jgi:hypothetical protein